MTDRLPLRRIARLAYGDALSADIRVEGKYAVVGSGGTSGTHNSRNFRAPGIVIGRKGSYGSIHWVPGGGFAIDTAYFIDETCTSADLRWLYYALQAVDLRGVSQDVGVPGLSRESAYQVLLPAAPSLEEQHRIADFLDAETSRIDEVTNAMQSEIGLLIQRRVQTIDRIWGHVNSVPLMRLGYATSLVTSGSRGWSDYVSDSGALFFRSANLRPDRIQPKLTNSVYVQIPSDSATEATRARITDGDVLVGITGANCGWVALANGAVAGGYVSQHVCLVRPDRHRISSKWLAYLIASRSVQDRLMGSQYGGTKTQLSLPDIRDLRVPVIPIADQEKLSGEITLQVNRIDSLRSLRFRQLDLLAERRQALITAAVTGQIDVSTASGRGIEE
ncbi:hypothetical protein [Streptomyces hyaluromycini]|uniref:restriction endonuclease subunit S n=1 Tax=Streptomyces hyaluromycini TaxID=1377993 RepID=UPI0011AE242C|nr:hypothetical protein [Streptomyces hyaluromycini]